MNPPDPGSARPEVSGTVASSVMGDWMAAPGFGVYVHIPFCLHRCHYCDFNTYEGQDALHEPYVEALIRDIETTPGEFTPATSVFFGGGTPTLLGAAHLAKILQAVRDRVGIASGAEVTVECNPETVDERYLSEARAAGFGRVSIGVQSLRPGVLAGLGRQHSAERALAAIDAAARAGFSDINGDLIYGSPWETADDWRASLEGVLASGVNHISAYALTLEEGTPLHTLVATGRVPDVDPDVQAERHEVAESLLGAAGFWRYEVSNWSVIGRASRHNVLYWSGGNYLGFGAGAHGHIDGRRYWNIRLPRDFIAAADAGATTEAGSEVVPKEDRASEALMLGLRLRSGIHLASFQSRYGSEHLSEKAAVLDELVERGFLTRGDGWLAVAPGSTMIANDIISRLM